MANLPRRVVWLQNVSGGVNTACVAAAAPGDPPPLPQCRPCLSAAPASVPPNRFFLSERSNVMAALSCGRRGLEVLYGTVHAAAHHDTPLHRQQFLRRASESLKKSIDQASPRNSRIQPKPRQILAPCGKPYRIRGGNKKPCVSPRSRLRLTLKAGTKVGAV